MKDRNAALAGWAYIASTWLRTLSLCRDIALPVGVLMVQLTGAAVAARSSLIHPVQLGAADWALLIAGPVALAMRLDAGFRASWRVQRQRAPADPVFVMIRVLLADEQVLVRAGLKVLLDARYDIVVIGEASDGADAVDLARRLRPDVILMDIHMPGLKALEAIRQIATDPELATVRVVILTTFVLNEYLFDALRFGASGFLAKDTEPADLVRAIRVVAQGDSLISPRMTRKVIAEFACRAKEPHWTAELDEITQLEREVTTLVADGLTNDEIARKLYMSPATVRTHVSRAMTKLGVRGRAQLVVLAYETGLVRPDWFV